MRKRKHGALLHRLGISVMLLALLFSLVPTVPGGVRPVRANAESFWLNKNAFGPGEVIMIELGTLTYVRSCPLGGIGDFIQSTSDIYVVRHDAVVGVGTVLKNLDPSGKPNTILSSMMGGGIFDEIIGFTTPGGKIGSGTWDIIEDTCQNGIFDGADTRFSPAFRVDVSVGVPALSVSTIRALKGEAEDQQEHWESAHSYFKNFFALLDAYEKLSALTDPADALIWLFQESLKRGLGIDPQQIAVNMLLNTARHYEGIAADPPDPDFDRITLLGERTMLDARNNDPLLGSTSHMATTLSDEEALLEALLASLERYQGAEEASDGDWALIHARAIKEYTDLLHDQLVETNAALAGTQAALLNDGRDLDTTASNIDLFSSRVISGAGFTDDELRQARNLGLDDNDLADAQNVLRDFDFGSFSETGMISTMQQIQIGNSSLITDLTNLSDSMEPIITDLKNNPLVSDRAPIADAGGPYTGVVGSPIIFDGTASTSTVALQTYRWDLDGDYAFDDATGPTTTFTYTRPFSGLVGVAVTNLNTYSDTAYAAITVSSNNRRPVLDGFSPSALTPTVEISETLTFSVSITEPDRDPWMTRWYWDGTRVTGAFSDTFVFSTTNPLDVGTHVVQAVVTDVMTSSVAGARLATNQEWLVYVVTRDGDGDGWRANTDCDDADAAVNPDQLEIVGNGKDDDCDVDTSDVLDLALSKTAGVTLTHPGQALTYTLTISNVIITQTVTGVLVTDTLPLHTTFITASHGATYDTDAHAVSWPPFDLVTQHRMARTVSVRVDAPVPAGLVMVTNTAVVTTTDFIGRDDNPLDNHTVVTTWIEAAPDLRIAKDDGGVAIVAGDRLTYTLAYTNTGDQGASGVQITETVPMHTRFNAAGSTPGWTCADQSSAGTACRFVVGDVAAQAGSGDGTSWGCVTFTLQVNEVLTPTVDVTRTLPITWIVNTAGILDDGLNGVDLNFVNNWVSKTTPVAIAPTLAPIAAQVMTEVTTLNVPISAHDLNKDSLRFSVVDLPAFGTLTDNGDGTGIISFAPGARDAGSHTITVVAKDVGGLTDAATFMLTVTEADVIPGFVTLRTPAGDGQLIIDVGAYGDFGYQLLPESVAPPGHGDALYDPVGPIGLSSTTWESALQLRLTQSGSDTQDFRSFLTTGLVGSKTPQGNLPDPGFIVTGTTSALSTFRIGALRFSLKQSVGDLFTGDQRTGSILNQVYEITNILTATKPMSSARQLRMARRSFEIVRYYEGDLWFDVGQPVPDGGGHLFKRGNELVFQTDLAGEPSSSAGFVGITAVGGIITQTGRYEINKWPACPEYLRQGWPLRDFVYGDGPDVDQFVDVGYDYDVGIALANRFENLPPGESVIYSTMTVFGSGDLQINANLVVTKTEATLQDPLVIGEPLTYWITVTNKGPFDATNVVVTDTLPARVTFASASASQGGCDDPQDRTILLPENLFVCRVGDLAVGRHITVSLVVTPTALGEIKNQVIARASEGNVNIKNSQDEETTLIICCPQDAYEEDDTKMEAVTLTVGVTQTHNFCDDATDWVTFTAQAGITYTLTTAIDPVVPYVVGMTLGGQADTVLSLFDADGQTLGENDNYEGVTDGSSRLAWQAPEDGLYYGRVTNKNGFGCGTRYKLWLESYQEPAPVIYLPVVVRGSGG